MAPCESKNPNQAANEASGTPSSGLSPFATATNLFSSDIASSSTASPIITFDSPDMSDASADGAFASTKPPAEAQSVGHADAALSSSAQGGKAKASHGHGPVVRVNTAAISDPHEMYENLVKGITAKISHKWWQTIGHGILAGAYIGLGGFLSLIVGTAPTLKAENPGLQKLVAGLAFPVGLLLVVVTGAELFTSNVIGVSTWLDSRTRTLRTLANMSSVWVWNFVGALFVAALAYWTDVFTDQFLANALSYTEHKVEQSFGTAFVKGIMTNWFVALAVLMAAAAHDFPGKVLAVWPPITAFVALGMEHSVANQFFLPLGLMLGADYTIGDMFVKNLIPVTIGNFVGSLLVSVAYALLESKVARARPFTKAVRSKAAKFRPWAKSRVHSIRPKPIPASQMAHHHSIHSHDTLHEHVQVDMRGALPAVPEGSASCGKPGAASMDV